jgi:hypothetical protein
MNTYKILVRNSEETTMVPRYVRGRKRKVKMSSYRHVGAKRERMYSSYTFLTSVLDGVTWSAFRPGHALPLGNDPQYPLDRRLGGPQSWSGHKG